MAAIDLPVPGSDFNTWGEKLNIAVTAVNAQGDPATVATTVATDIATPDSAIETALSAKNLKLPHAAISRDTPLWNPPTQPAMASVKALTHEQRLAAWWEPLRNSAAGADYITREDIGLDASGVHTMWAYHFTPAAYDRTIVVLANMHGGEKIGAFNAWKLMQYVTEQWDTSPWLTWARHNVRIVVVPSANPWGGSSLTGERVNSNGVDINRNWDYEWAAYVVPSPPYEKGASAFSEVETQNLRDLCLSLDGLVSVIDCHDTGETVAASPIYYYAATPDYPVSPRAGFIRQVVDALKAPGEIASLHPNSEPISCNWLASQGWRSAVIEYEQRGTALDSANTTAALAWFANCILRSAIDPPAPANPQAEPVVMEMSFSTGASGLALAAHASTYSELESLHHEFVAPGPGLVIFEGEVTVGGAIANVFLRPALSQASGQKPILLGASTNERYSNLATTSERPTIPFRIAMDVHEDVSPSWVVKLGLFARSDVATVNVYRYVATATFLPAERADRYQRLTATGRSGVGAMQGTYPA